MIYFVFGRLLCHYVYFGVAKVATKIVQMSEKHQVYLNVFPNAAYLMKRQGKDILRVIKVICH